jgi:hypothetical protein
MCLSARHVKNIVLKAHYHSGNFVKCDWPTQIFRGKKIFEVENFQLLTMIFSENFLSVEIFLCGNEPLRFLHMMNVRFSLLNMAQRILGVTLPNF